MHDAYTPIVFQRYNRQLRTVLIDQQPWFVADDFGRLISERHSDRICRRMDEDQLGTIWLGHASGTKEQVQVINESGAYKALFRFPHPENRSLRVWLSNEVIPALLDMRNEASAAPRRVLMGWGSKRVSVLEWQGELWVPMHHLPNFCHHHGASPNHESVWRSLILRRPH